MVEQAPFFLEAAC